MFGGTFDPPHVGHFLALNAAIEQLGLGRVYVVVANDPWQKSSDTSITPAEHRLAMCQLAFAASSNSASSADQADHALISVSDCEIERGGASYTIDTVKELISTSNASTTQSGLGQSGLVQSGLVKPVLIVGEDVAAGLDSWHGASSLRELVTVAVVRRSHELARHPVAPVIPAGWEAVTVTLDLSVAIDSQMVVDVASTAIRRQIADGCLPTGIVEPAVMDYISSNGFYSQASTLRPGDL